MSSMSKKNIDYLLVSPTALIIDALKQLEGTAMRTLVVANDAKQLLGTLTDGDIRKQIIHGANLYSPITSFYNQSPQTVSFFDKTHLKRLFLKHKIMVIPIVDSQNKIVDIISWDALFSDKSIFKSKNTITNTVVVMAGGKGIRMAPFTHILPKPLIPIEGKTIMEYIMDTFIEQGVASFYATINFKSSIIEAYFKGMLNSPYSLSFLKENSYGGTASSLSLLPKQDQEIIINNCDVIIKADYSKIIETHRKKKATLTIVASIHHFQIPYGVIEQDSNGHVMSINEKPERSYIINSGVYILNPDIIALIPKDQKFDMTDLIELLIKNNQRVVSYPISASEFVDIGNWDSYRQALQQFSKMDF